MSDGSAPLALLIDTDPGVDDALAILMAARHPAARIHALFTVGGNVGLEHTTRNALRVLEQAGIDAPVYAGCDQALVLQAEDAAYVHGMDGLGGVGWPDPHRSAESEHAVLAMLRMLRAQPGHFTLVCLGPLTNLAVALHLEPRLPQYWRRLVVMGGAVTGRGNTPRLAAEFNFFADPEAARVVFDRCPELVLVDWELTLRMALQVQEVQQLRSVDSANGRFFQAISAHVLDFLAREQCSDGGMTLADPLAMAVALEPGIVRDQQRRAIDICLTGEHTRGQSLVDWDQRGARPAQADIVLDLDRQRWIELMMQGLDG